MGVRVHLRVFFIVNCLLMALNLILGLHYPWFLWPLMSWGIGLAIHSSVIFILNRFPRNSQRGFLIHLACFLTLSVYLLFVNVITGIWYFYPWVLWPVSAMAIGIGEHFVAFKYIQGREMHRPTSRFHTLWYPGVVCLYLAFVNFMTGFWQPWFLWPSIPIMLIAFVIVGTVTQTRMIEHPSAPLHHEIPSNEHKRILPTQTLERSSDRRFCPRCGETVTSTHPFCEYCGMKLQ